MTPRRKHRRVCRYSGVNVLRQRYYLLDQTYCEIFYSCSWYRLVALPHRGRSGLFLRCFHVLITTQSNPQCQHVFFVQPMIRISINVQSFVERARTFSHCSHVCGSGLTPMARQRACHQAKSLSAPYYMRNSLSNTS